MQEKELRARETRESRVGEERSMKAERLDQCMWERHGRENVRACVCVCIYMCMCVWQEWKLKSEGERIASWRERPTNIIGLETEKEHFSRIVNETILEMPLLL